MGSPLGNALAALGLPSTLSWHDSNARPHSLYHGAPIAGLT